ncbi:54S ribosomal protein L39, mitochondrial [Podila epicladia]|nr:54S ribosomal protein L39, mitochondrial [Podila epicladia]KAG0096834.1 54S ribosomal protein L39, mitochondrial [Podila epicladia]
MLSAHWRHVKPSCGSIFAPVRKQGQNALKSMRHPLRQLSTAFEKRAIAFTEEKARQQALWIKQHKDGNTKPIEILLPDGSKRTGAAGSTTPLEIAQGISGKLAKTTLIAQLNGNTLWDMSRPLDESCKLELIPFQENNDHLTSLFWHSSAHVLGMSLEAKYGSRLLLCDGPAIKQGGFFYEFLLMKEAIESQNSTATLAELLQQNYPSHSFSHEELADLQRIMNQFIAQRLPFERLKVSQEFAYNLFPENKFKQHFIGNIPKDSTDITLYKCGPFVDLCRGPHVQHTGQLQAMEILRTSNAYFMPELDKDPKSPQALTRMYGISFPSAKELKQWHHQRSEAEKRDHRVIGKNQGLFAVHPASPGSAFMLPHGTRIVERLLRFMRQQYRKYGFEEVMTPLMYKKELWETSGHWQNYKDDMFQVMRGCDHHHHEGHEQGSEGAKGGDTNKPAAEGLDEVFGLKPMNCPGHCLIFDMSTRSYKDLPIRYADFSALHRNESTGSLSGLTRVRRFHQDDAHIFCRRDQTFDEIKSTLSFVQTVYKTFKFPSYELALSTRPLSGFIGTTQEWDSAEDSLRQALDQSGIAWSINEGDGAFYGPKIDILVRDALGRRHQTATIQLDFQLPQRFGLQYHDAQGEKQSPVIVHRAVLGSVERMMAILIEHTGGRWPFWISPRQAMVVPVFGGKAGLEEGSQDEGGKMGLTEYATHVRDLLAKGGRASYGLSAGVGEGKDNDEAEQDPVVRMDHKHYFVDLDQSGGTLNKMVRDAQVAQYNFILVIGEKEKSRGTVNVRTREGDRLGEMTVPQVLELFQQREDQFL